MSETNGKLNNSQRQALVKVLESTYDRRIQDQRERQDEARRQVTKEVKDELGVSSIDDELEELKNRIVQLESKKEKFGFSKYNDHPIPDSEAFKMIQDGISPEKEKTARLESEKAVNITQLWTATDLSEAKQLVDSVLHE